MSISGMMQGVPIRLELGFKDLEKKSAVLARRDTGAKETVALTDVAARVPELLEQIQVRAAALLFGYEGHHLYVMYCAIAGQSKQREDDYCNADFSFDSCGAG